MPHNRGFAVFRPIRHPSHQLVSSMYKISDFLYFNASQKGRQLPEAQISTEQLMYQLLGLRAQFPWYRLGNGVL